MSVNSGRRNLNDDQRAAIAYKVLQARSAVAKRERAETAVAVREEKAGRKPILEATSSTKSERPPAVPVDTSSTLVDEPEEQPRTRAVVAEQAKVTEWKLRGISEVAKKAPELVQEIAAGKVTIKAAQKKIRQQERAEAREAIHGPSYFPFACDKNSKADPAVY